MGMHRASKWFVTCIVLSLMVVRTGFSDDPPKSEPKKPTSIFDFGVEPIGGADPDPDAKVDPKPKPDSTPKVEVPKGDKPAAKPKNDAPKGELDTSEMLKACHVSADGVITVDREITFGLKGTQGKDFVISGEMYPMAGKAEGGGIVFHLRQQSGLKRYELSIGGMRVKRILLEGKPVKKFATPMTFQDVAREEWHPFRIEVSTDAITARFGDEQGTAQGPLAMKGTNNIVLRPGAKLKNLKIEVREPKA